MAEDTREAAPDAVDTETKAPVIVPIGPELKAAREAKGLAIADISDELRIRPHLLEALEADDYERFAGVVYAVGFLRAYAQHLGLDAAELVERLRFSQQTKACEVSLNFLEPLEDARMPRRWMAVAASILCLFVYGAWNAFASKGEDAFETVPEVGPGFAVSQNQQKPGAAPAVAEEAAVIATITVAATPKRSLLSISQAEAAPTPAAQPGVRLASVEYDSGQKVTLLARRDAWVRIEGPDNKAIVDKVLRAGESYEAPSAPGLRMTTGNAGALDVAVDGKVVGALGPQGAIRRDIVLADLPGSLAKSH